MCRMSIRSEFPLRNLPGGGGRSNINQYDGGGEFRKLKGREIQEKRDGEFLLNQSYKILFQALTVYILIVISKLFIM